MKPQKRGKGVYQLFRRIGVSRFAGVDHRVFEETVFLAQLYSLTPTVVPSMEEVARGEGEKLRGKKLMRNKFKSS